MEMLHVTGRMTPKEMAAQIGSGLLSFPVTPFKADLGFDETRYRENLDWLCRYDVAGLFAAGGTGGVFFLAPARGGRGGGGAPGGAQGPGPGPAAAGRGAPPAPETGGGGGG